MLKGTWGRVDSKLDMGFHCVRPTEIGNAILCCVFQQSPGAAGRRKPLSLAKIKSALPHALLKNGLAGAGVQAGLT